MSLNIPSCHITVLRESTENDALNSWPYFQALQALERLVRESRLDIAMAAVSASPPEPRRIIAIGRPTEERKLIDSAREAYDAWRLEALPRFGFLSPDGFRRRQDVAHFPTFDQVLKKELTPQKLKMVLAKLREGVLLGNLGLMVCPEVSWSLKPKINPEANFHATFAALVAAIAEQLTRGGPELYADRCYGKLPPYAFSFPIVAWYFYLSEADPLMPDRDSSPEVPSWCRRTSNQRADDHLDFCWHHGLKADDRVSAAVVQLFGLHNNTPMARYPADEPNRSYEMLPADPLRRQPFSTVPVVFSSSSGPHFLRNFYPLSVGARLRSRVGGDEPFF